MRDRTPSYFKIETVFLRSTEYRTLSDAAKDVYQLLCSWVLENRRDVIDERNFEGLIGFFRRLASDRKRTTIVNCLEQFLANRLVVTLGEGMIYIRGLRRMHENNKFRFDPRTPEIDIRIEAYRKSKKDGLDPSIWYKIEALKNKSDDPMDALRLPYGCPTGAIGEPKGLPMETLRHEETSAECSTEAISGDSPVHKCDTNREQIEHKCAIPHNITQRRTYLGVVSKPSARAREAVPAPVHPSKPQDHPRPSRTAPEKTTPEKTSNTPRPSSPCSTDPSSTNPSYSKLVSDEKINGKRRLLPEGEAFLRDLHTTMSEDSDAGVTKAMNMLHAYLNLGAGSFGRILKIAPDRLCQCVFAALTEADNPPGYLVTLLKNQPDFGGTRVYDEVKRILFTMTEDEREFMGELLKGAR